MTAGRSLGGRLSPIRDDSVAVSPSKRPTIQDALVRESALISQCYEQLNDLEKKLFPVTEQRPEKPPEGAATPPDDEHIIVIINTHSNALEGLAGRIGYLRERVQL
jgi:hypothetical protein